jgi:outer membrane protein, heavy metal efflux system
MVFALLRASFACAAVYFLALAQTRAAEDFVSSSELTLAEAIETALARNPDLVASRYELTVAQARITQAGLRPSPQLDADFENFAGSGATGRADALETTLTLSQVIELGGKRALRSAAAQASLEVTTIEQRALELDTLAEVTRRYIDIVAAQERLRATQQASNLARQTLQAIRARVDAARSPLAEQSRAQIALTRATLAEQQAGSELRAARYALAALWGDAEPSFTSVNGELYRADPVPSFQAYFDRVERTPEILRFASEGRLRDAELRLAQAYARPNIGVGIGVRRFEASSDTALVAGFSVPLALSDRNQGTLREAQARRAQSGAQRTAALTRTRASLYALYQQMNTARMRSDTLRNEVLPLAQTALEQTQNGYERGRFSFLELASAQQELLELQGAAIDAAADFHRFRGEIERLTHEPLSATLESVQP